MFVKIPNYGEIITSSVVSKVYKKPGEMVAKDEVVLDVETEKATLEIRSLYAGKIKKMLVI